jgi:hypothetical protein
MPAWAAIWRVEVPLYPCLANSVSAASRILSQVSWDFLCSFISENRLFLGPLRGLEQSIAKINHSIDIKLFGSRQEKKSDLPVGYFLSDSPKESLSD